MRKVEDLIAFDGFVEFFRIFFGRNNERLFLCAARRSTVRQELGYQRGGCFSSGYVEQLSLVQSNVEGIDVITDGLDDCIKMFSIFFDSISRSEKHHLYEIETFPLVPWE